LQKNDKDNHLFKHTAAIHISNNLSLLERKLFNVLLLNAYTNLQTKELHIIDFKELSNNVGWSNVKSYNEIKEALSVLNTTQIQWNILNKDKKNTWIATTVLSQVKFYEGYCEYAYSPMMRDHLSSPNIYAKLNLLVQNCFKSKYSLALWEFLTEELKDCNQKITDFINVDDFRKIIGAEEDYYSDYRKLNQKIISNSLNEINTKSDLKVNSMQQKEGRKVKSLAFNVKREKEKISQEIMFELPNDDNIEIINPEIIQLKNRLSQEFKLSNDVVLNIINNRKLDDINHSLNYVTSELDKGLKIRNIASYVVKAINEKWQIHQQSSILSISPELSLIIEERIESEENPMMQEILKFLHQKFGNETFKSWFYDFKFMAYDEEDFVLHIGVKNKFIKNWVEKNYFKYIEEFLVDKVIVFIVIS
jgi:plasmid replication initiation protein